MGSLPSLSSTQIEQRTGDYVAESVGPLAPNASAAVAANIGAACEPRRTKQPGPSASRRICASNVPISAVTVAFLHLLRKCDSAARFPIFPLRSVS